MEFLYTMCYDVLSLRDSTNSFLNCYSIYYDEQPAPAEKSIDNKHNVKGGNCMKKLEIIIKPERLEDLKQILNDNNASGLMITNIMGYGKQKGYINIYRGTEYHVNLLPKVKVETVVPAEIAEIIIEKVLKEINTGNYGDGKIFIYDVEDVVRIRTGERGNDAL